LGERLGPGPGGIRDQVQGTANKSFEAGIEVLSTLENLFTSAAQAGIVGIRAELAFHLGKLRGAFLHGLQLGGEVLFQCLGTAFELVKLRIEAENCEGIHGKRVFHKESEVSKSD
jgi:hypothetical protein